MFPWHLVPLRTPAEQAEIAKRFQRMHDRFDMAMEIVESAEGFIVSRDGNRCLGATRQEAIAALHDKEHYDAVDPEGFRHQYMNGSVSQYKTFPWHEVPQRTAEEKAEIAKRFRRKDERFFMPMEIVESADGFTASRDGNTGHGATRQEAIADLGNIEHYDAVDPEGIRHQYLNAASDLEN